MPERDYVWLPRDELLTFDELVRWSRLFVGAGVDRIRLTGGEPLARSGLPTLIEGLAGVRGLRDLSMTTNAVLLAPVARDLRAAGLDRVTISLDSLDAERFRQQTQRDDFGRVIAGIDAAIEAGFESVKLNMVVIDGTNDDEIVGMLRFARERGIEVRYIEYMDVGGATLWAPNCVVARSDILRRVADEFGPVEPAEPQGSAPAARYRLADGTKFGVISSTTQPFCGACDRVRLTADGKLFTCLYARSGADLRQWMRGGETDEQLGARLTQLWTQRSDRGAEQRLAMAERRPLASADELKRDPHLEMHTRGG